MQNKGIQETTSKTIRMEKELILKIQKMANENERDFSSQVRFMLKKFIELKE